MLLPGSPPEALAAQAAPLVAAALEGRAAAALALGRSGAGKTWCLTGGGPQQPGGLSQAQDSLHPPSTSTATLFMLPPSLKNCWQHCASASPRSVVHEALQGCAQLGGQLCAWLTSPAAETLPPAAGALPTARVMAARPCQVNHHMRSNCTELLHVCAGVMALLAAQIFARLAAGGAPAARTAPPAAGAAPAARVHMTAYEIVGERIADLLAPPAPPRRAARTGRSSGSAQGDILKFGEINTRGLLQTPF